MAKKFFTSESLSTFINEIKTFVNDIASTKANVTTTINGKELSSDITLSASDVDAYTKAEIDAFSFVTTDDIDEICGATIVAASEVTF